MHRRVSALVLAAAAVAIAAGGGSARSAGPAVRHAAFVAADVGAATSSNWAGYAAADAGLSTTPTAFTAVAGSWVQPPAACAAGGEAYSAFWVGLGGFTEESRAIEQTGTESDCTPAGRPFYGVWYELLPAPPVTVRLKVGPGDVISAAVAVSGTTVTIKIRNRTRHTAFAKRLRMAAPDRTSAEWIAEAPSTCSPTACQPLPLANFGTVSFNGATAIGTGHHGTISDPAWAATAVTLHGATDSSRGRPVGVAPAANALPSVLGSNGTSFSVAWQAQ
ncbi:MAG: hypothetical protein V7644_2585 [Actinomycetota bacterium]|jgi:hypothetical protein